MPFVELQINRIWSSSFTDALQIQRSWKITSADRCWQSMTWERKSIQIRPTSSYGIKIQDPSTFLLDPTQMHLKAGTWHHNTIQHNTKKRIQQKSKQQKTPYRKWIYCKWICKWQVFFIVFLCFFCWVFTVLPHTSSYSRKCRTQALSIGSTQNQTTECPQLD